MVIASAIHWFLANYLAVTLDMRMLGISISTCIHFIIRYISGYFIMKFDKDLNKFFIPFSDPESYDKAGLTEMNSLGWSVFAMRVMGWWANDVFTILATNLTDGDVAA